MRSTSDGHRATVVVWVNNKRLISCRVLLERLIVNRPHPWGLLVTFIELIRNQSYKFWGHDFVHCSPEIERLFETVARSCNQNRSQAGPGSAAPPTTMRQESEPLPSM